ncbi:hypothetical protein Aros01_07338 [Streptosporangium roseum]
MCPAASVVKHWDLSAQDKAALTGIGLPVDGLMTPGFQREAEPLLTPDLAGPYERGLISADQRLYDLGRWEGTTSPPRWERWRNS